MLYNDLIASIELYTLAAAKVFGPYTTHHNRKIVIIKDENGKSRTVSYPKYLVEQSLGRKLLPNETVDHQDSNIDNNNLDNLKVIDRSEHSKLDTRRVKHVKYNCAFCQKEFERSPRLIRDKAKKGASGPFCSRRCAGMYSRKVQLGLIDKLPAQEHIESEYFKNKHLASVADYLTVKYAMVII